MKLIYISPLRYPSEKAGSLFSLKSCEVFADEGVETELWIPRRRNNLTDRDPFEYSSVKRNFKIRRFLVIDVIGYIPWGFYVMSFTFAVSVLAYVLVLKLTGKSKDYIYYSHEQIALYVVTFLSGKTVYEMHDFPSTNFIYRIFFKRVGSVISTNTWKSERVSKLFNVSKDKIITVPNAVDLNDFSTQLSKDEARNALKLPLNGCLVGYVGALKTMGMEKGITVLIDSLNMMPENFRLYIIGGSKEDIAYYKDYTQKRNIEDRIIFAGNVPHKDIDMHMKACDCLVAPYPKTDHYSYYMSPMKIFEYMASGRPMIVTDLPSIRELVDERTAVFVPPGESKALASAVEKIVNNKELAYTLATNARIDAEEKYTWKRRARIILSKIS